ncbi:MAG: hypothetical protein CMO81_02085 [Waddliaceae bacterium]|nr:hypothetical protein [Waddliaceae bacterium]
MRSMPLAVFSFILLFLFISIFGSNVLTRLRLKGRIPVVTSLSINGDEQKNGTAFTKRLEVLVDAADIARGSIIIIDALRLGDIQANLPVYLEMRAKDWQLNNPIVDRLGFFTPDPQSKAIEVRVARLERESGTLLAVQEGFNRLDEVAGKILQVGQVSSEGYYSGLRGGQAELDLRIPLDPSSDLPGLYRLDLEILVSPQFDF